MSTLGVAWALARRRAVYGVAVIAAVVCGLSSLIMQELASGQRDNYKAQMAEDRRQEQRCQKNPSGSYCRDVNAGTYRSYDESLRRSTDELGARAKPLQSPLGAVRFTQGWLLTLIGLTTLIVAAAVTTASDRASGRFIPAWHPTGKGLRGLIVGILTAILATMIVAAGAAVGAFVAAAVGRGVWPLGGEPTTASLPDLGPVELTVPSIGGIAAVLTVALTLGVASWLTGRVLTFVLGGAVTVAVLALLNDSLPAWVPLTQLPATSGTWLHHRGEVGMLWRWPVTSREADGVPSLDWTALAESNPQTAAMIGLLLLLVLTALALPSAIKQPSK